MGKTKPKAGKVAMCRTGSTYTDGRKYPRLPLTAYSVEHHPRPEGSWFIIPSTDRVVVPGSCFCKDRKCRSQERLLRGRVWADRQGADGVC